MNLICCNCWLFFCVKLLLFESFLINEIKLLQTQQTSLWIDQKTCLTLTHATTTTTTAKTTTATLWTKKWKRFVTIDFLSPSKNEWYCAALSNPFASTRHLWRMALLQNITKLGQLDQNNTKIKIFLFKYTFKTSKLYQNRWHGSGCKIWNQSWYLEHICQFKCFLIYVLKMWWTNKYWWTSLV